MNFRSQALGCPPLQWGLECRPRSRNPPRTLLQAVLRYLPVARGGQLSGWSQEVARGTFGLVEPCLGASRVYCAAAGGHGQGWKASGLRGLEPCFQLLLSFPGPSPTLTQVLLPLGLS